MSALVDPAEVLEAVAWCRLGSSSGARPTEAGFREAEQLGLLKHHPTWHATAQGEGALIAAGKLKGKPAPEAVVVHVLWARLRESEPGSPWPQFVSAFPDGLVDCWPNSFDRQRADAEADFLKWFDADDAVAEFFVTVAEIARPALEQRLENVA